MIAYEEAENDIFKALEWADDVWIDIGYTLVKVTKDSAYRAIKDAIVPIEVDFMINSVEEGIDGEEHKIMHIFYRNLYWEF